MVAKKNETDEGEIYDLIGLGFGPSNLALMATIEEEAAQIHGRPLKCLFIERKPDFCWHPDMLLEGALVQLSFLKDLVTLRNPKSDYTFLSYLMHKGRLDQFVNMRNFFPSRLEFNDYYSWVAGQLREHVLYGTSVTSVSPIETKQRDKVELVKVKTSCVETHKEQEFLARNLVVATGGIPTVPEGIDLSGSKKVFHSNDFLRSLRREFTDLNAPYRFVVIGSGQSAAELFRYLYMNYPKADVTATLRRFAYKPADESHFVNEIFFPSMEDFLYDLPEEKRRSILTAHRDTNYSCVDREVIEDIYKEIYEAKVAGEERFRIQPFLELRKLKESPTGVVLEFHDVVRERAEFIEADGVVLATGFMRPKMPPIIGDLSSYLHVDHSGHYKVDRRYRVVTAPDFGPRVFLQGFCEDSHGLSDTLLSTLPARAMGILQQLTIDDNSNTSS